MKHFSEACERNKEPILNVLKEIINKDDRRLLEVGAGTGQHAVYMAPFFPHLDWVISDRKVNHPHIKEWLAEFNVPNISGPIPYEIGKDDFPKLKFDVVFTANTFHIMHWKECKTFIKELGHRLREGSEVLIYGPFNYDGKFTSPSNEQFDRQLKEKDPLSGIRSFEDVDRALVKQGFEKVNDYEMPANNRLLVYTRLAFVK